MPDEPGNLVLRYLRRIDERLDRMHEQLTSLTTRVSGLEAKMSIASADLVRLDVRMDLMHQRLGRIGRRLELVQA